MDKILQHFLLLLLVAVVELVLIITVILQLELVVVAAVHLEVVYKQVEMAA